VALAGLACVLVGAVGATPAAARPDRARASHVVVVGVAGLRWEDVSTERTPTLARLARDGSVGSLSVRSAPSVTCAGEGWLTLGAGTYAAVEDPGATKASRGCGPRRPPPVGSRDGAPRVRTMPLLKRVNDGLRFGAKPGLLGDTVTCTAAVGPGAALAVANEVGGIGSYAPTLPADPGPLLASCPLVAVDLGSLPDGGAARDRALADFDAALALVDEHRPDGSVLLVAGVAETDASQPRLHVAVASGHGFRGGWLHSSSTRRDPYAQLVDLAPTVLELLGKDVPESLAGRPLTGGGAGRPDDLADATRELADTDTAAVGHRAAVGPFFAGLGVATLLGYGGLLWLLLRRRRGRPYSAEALRRFGIAALGLAAVPGGTFLANLVPWWRAGQPALALGALVLVAVAITVGIAYAGPWRRTVTGPVAAVAAVLVVVTLVDGVTGANLQLDSMLGYNPLVAGRFVGFGNIAFAAFGAAVMLLAALLAYGRSRVAALGVVAAIGIPMVVVDALPAWGADFGGVLTFVPAFAVLALLVARSRISAARLLLAVGGGVLLVGAIGVIDYLRPPESRSHFGRFVAAVLDGSAGDTVYRKFLTSVDLLFNGAHTVAAFGLVVWLAVLVFRPSASLREAYTAVAPLRVALISVVVLSFIGFATNDSSVAIPLVAGMVAVPATLAIIAAALAGRPVAQEGLATDVQVPFDATPTTRTTPDTPVVEIARPTEVLP
jgi:hypothetical protein